MYDTTKQRPNSVKIVCKVCQKTFFTHPYRVKRSALLLCSKECHNQLRTHTDPVARFWAKVEKTETCWVWQGLVNHGGYGVFAPISGKPKLSHRYIWEITNNRTIPKGMVICHKCDNPPCVNPAHLFLGTHADNIADKLAKGKRASSNSKLDRTKAQEIRARFNQGGISISELATLYNVAHSSIGKIIQNISYRSILE